MTISEIKEQKENIKDNSIYELNEQKEQIIEAMNAIHQKRDNRYSKEYTIKEERLLESYQDALDVFEELIAQYETIIETYDNALKLRYFGGEKC